MKKITSILLCLIMILSAAACGSGGKTADLPKSEEKSQPSEAAAAKPEVKPESAAQEEYSFDPDELQYAYNEIIDGILEEMSTNIPDKSNLDYWISMSRGDISDMFGWGTNQMTLVYSPDGVNLKAGIFLLDRNGKLMSHTMDVAQLAGAAECEVIPGEYGDKETVYVLYRNTDGDKLFGELYGYDVSGEEIKCIFSQSFEGADGLKKISETGDVYLGATACSFGENGRGKVINTMQAT